MKASPEHRHLFFRYLLDSLMAFCAIYIAYYILKFVWDVVTYAFELLDFGRPEQSAFLMFVLAVFIFIVSYSVREVFFYEKPKR